MRQSTLANDPAVAVALGRFDPDRLVVSEGRQTLLRPLGAWLAALRRVYTSEPDPVLGPAGVENGDRVADGDTITRPVSTACALTLMAATKQTTPATLRQF